MYPGSNTKDLEVHQQSLLGGRSSPTTVSTSARVQKHLEPNQVHTQGLLPVWAAYKILLKEELLVKYIYIFFFFQSVTKAEVYLSSSSAPFFVVSTEAGCHPSLQLVLFNLVRPI